MSFELPKDAEGREIPLETTVLYDDKGEELYVKHVEFDPFSKKWAFITTRDPVSWNNIYRNPENVYLVKPAPPDSWEKLLEDLETCDVCEYFGYLKRASKEDYGCANCQVYKTSENRPEDSDCLKRMFMDIAFRIRKLRG